MPRIDDDAIRAIRERASLIEVVSDVVALRRRGRSATGLCPFHAEKTPSFHVSEERGFYHCFGCGEHGDVFGFLMKTEGLPFPDAVRCVAERFGMPIPETVRSAPRRPTEPLVAVNTAAHAFFQEMLTSDAGGKARAYLAERGVSLDAVRRFGLGYAPAHGEALVRHLRAKGLPTEAALTVGVIVRREQPGSNPLYDRFRDRIMFPITDATGKLIAFGGRVLPGSRSAAAADGPPKYLNSPESPLFHKGQTLYGLALAREAIRSRARVIVVEGYLDVIMLSQAGIGEVVAPLGTALTGDQLRVLRRFSETILACFDGDTAGRRAAARSFPVFLEAGLWGRGVFLPSDEDPDSFVRKHGPAAFEACLAAAAPLVDAFTASLAIGSPDAVGRRVDAAREVARLMRRLVTDKVEFGVLAHLAAERLGVSEELLRREATTSPSGAKPVPAVTFGAETQSAPGAEERLVELMAADAAMTEQVRSAGVIGEFENQEWRALAEQIVALDPTTDRTTLMQELPRPLRDRVALRLLGEMDDERERVLVDCINSIHHRRQRGTAQRLQEELRAAEQRGDRAAEETLKQKLIALRSLSSSPKSPTS